MGKRAWNLTDEEYDAFRALATRVLGKAGVSVYKFSYEHAPGEDERWFSKFMSGDKRSVHFARHAFAHLLEEYPKIVFGDRTVRDAFCSNGTAGTPPWLENKYAVSESLEAEMGLAKGAVKDPPVPILFPDECEGEVALGLIHILGDAIQPKKFERALRRLLLALTGRRDYFAAAYALAADEFGEASVIDGLQALRSNIDEGIETDETVTRFGDTETFGNLSEVRSRAVKLIDRARLQEMRSNIDEGIDTEESIVRFEDLRKMQTYADELAGRTLPSHE